MRTTDSLLSRAATPLAHPRMRAGLVACLLLASTGCQSMALSAWNPLKLKEVDGAKVEDPWTTQAGAEGRAGRAMEKEYDPLHLRKFLMSEKAMEIERNCGFE